MKKKIKKIIISTAIIITFLTMFLSENITPIVHANLIYFQDEYTVNVWNGYIYLPVEVSINVNEEYERRNYGVYITKQASYMTYNGLVLSNSSYCRTEYLADGEHKDYSPLYVTDPRNTLYDHRDYNYCKWEPSSYALRFINYASTINTHTTMFVGNYSPSETCYKTKFRYSY